MRIYSSLLFLFVLGISPMLGQGLEDVYVETYYVVSDKDEKKSDGQLKEGMVTYRIYIDLEEDYVLEAVFGNEEHNLEIKTDTYFYNHKTKGDRAADRINPDNIGIGPEVLDSWLSTGGTSKIHLGVPKHLDPDGSVYNPKKKKAKKCKGLLSNQNQELGESLYESDGQIEGEVPMLTSMNIDLGTTNVRGGNEIIATDGIWFSEGGVTGATEENMILIGQLTTDGNLSFKLNIQVQGKYADVHQFVAEPGEGGGIVFSKLSYDSSAM